MKEKIPPLVRKVVKGRCSKCRALCHEFRYDEVCYVCYVREEVASEKKRGVPLRKYESHPDILIPGTRK